MMAHRGSIQSSCHHKHFHSQCTPKNSTGRRGEYQTFNRRADITDSTDDISDCIYLPRISPVSKADGLVKKYVKKGTKHLYQTLIGIGPYFTHYCLLVRMQGPYPLVDVPCWSWLRMDVPTVCLNCRIILERRKSNYRRSCLISTSPDGGTLTGFLQAATYELYIYSRKVYMHILHTDSVVLVFSLPRCVYTSQRKTVKQKCNGGCSPTAEAPPFKLITKVGR